MRPEPKDWVNFVLFEQNPDKMGIPAKPGTGPHGQENLPCLLQEAKKEEGPKAN
jgi:hypothetical protein